MRSSRGPRSLQAALVGVALAGGLVLLVWAASTGPGAAIRGGPAAQTYDPSPSTNPTTGATDAALPRPHGSPVIRLTDLSWVGAVLQTVLVLIALGGCVLLARWLVSAWRGRRRDLRDAGGFEVLPDVDRAREELHGSRDEQLAALEDGSPRNGIVACWVLFEDAARVAGVGRLPAETPTEFITRFLHRLDVDPRAAATLAELYHEARFSTHPLPADARERARSAVEQVHRDLAATGVQA